MRPQCLHRLWYLALDKAHNQVRVPSSTTRPCVMVICKARPYLLAHSPSPQRRTAALSVPYPRANYRLPNRVITSPWTPLLALPSSCLLHRINCCLATLVDQWAAANPLRSRPYHTQITLLPARITPLPARITFHQ